MSIGAVRFVLLPCSTNSVYWHLGMKNDCLEIWTNTTLGGVGCVLFMFGM